MQKPVFQGILWVSIAVSAISLGIMLTRYLSLLSYSPKAPPVSVPARAARASASVSPENWKNIFSPSAGMKLPSRLPPVGAVTGSGVRSNYLLLGTIVSTRPGDSRAVLWADGMKLPRLVRVDTEVEPGAILVSVTRDKAWIRRGSVREELDLLPVGSKGRPAGPDSASAPAPAPAGRAAAARKDAGAATGEAALRVQRLGENSFAIDEAGVTQLTENINQYISHVRIVPYFEGNKSAGYRIAAIRPGTAFDKLGFQGGDVLQQVNGVALSSPEKMYTIFQSLKDEKQVTVDIIRKGKKSTLKYEIR
jgi:type II secretion system protein C